jgi:hypothetical protein
LFKREYDFMNAYGEHRHDPDHFRRWIFKGFTPVEFIKERTATFFILLMISLFAGFPSTVVLLFKLNPSFKVAVSVGAFTNMTIEYICRLFFNFSIYSAVYSLIP